MADYLVLARKYRSATFEEVVGQEHVAQTLKNAIAIGRVAHAFLFTGTRGVGKTTMARILAKSLNCLAAEGPTAQPCNKCDACLAIARGEDVDVVEIDGASNRGIDEIRELRSNAIYRPARSRYKIYYIDEVHMLTRDAFNALLKTLEEPPAHVKFIFATTEVEKLPATVVSRCQRFDFRNIPTAQIAAHLRAICKDEQVQAQEGAIYRVARAAAGSMRDALSLLDQLMSAGAGQVSEQDVIRVLGSPADERTAGVVKAIADGDAGAALAALDGLLVSGVTLESAIAAIAEMFRNMMLASACTAGSELIELPDSQRAVVGELAGRFTLPALVQAVTICQNTARSLRGLTSGRGLAEAALVRLAAAEKFVDAASLVERLERLSGQSVWSGPASSGAGGGYAPRPGPPAGGGSSFFGEKKKPLSSGEAASLQQSTAAAPGSSASAPAAVPVGPGQDVSDSAAANGGNSPAAMHDAAAAPLPWELGFLQGNWPAVIAALARERAGHLSGLLGPAKVVSAEGDLLKLGYEPAHEPIRVRAQKLDAQIAPVLGRIFGRSIRCEYVAAAGGDAGKTPPAAPAQVQSLSTAERTEIAKDPAVKAVLEFFDGSITHMKRVASAADEAQAEGDGGTDTAGEAPMAEAMENGRTG